MHILSFLSEPSSAFGLNSSFNSMLLTESITDLAKSKIKLILSSILGFSTVTQVFQTLLCLHGHAVVNPGQPEGVLFAHPCHDLLISALKIYH